MEHKPMQVEAIFPGANSGIPQEVKDEEGRAVDWAKRFYLDAMRITAAASWRREGALEKAASFLWWAGFRVPYGFLPEEEEDLEDEEALQRYVELDEDGIKRAYESIGLLLAAKGQLIDDVRNYIKEAEEANAS